MPNMSWDDSTPFTVVGVAEAQSDAWAEVVKQWEEAFFVPNIGALVIEQLNEVIAGTYSGSDALFDINHPHFSKLIVTIWKWGDAYADLKAQQLLAARADGESELGKS
jgi:hypothetical protein